MNRREAIPIITVSLLLLFYAVLILFQVWIKVAEIIFILSPLFIGWMEYSVIRYGKYKYRELNENEEWGYADTDKPHSIVND